MPATQTRKRLTRDQAKAQTRSRLLQAAGTVFARRGFQAASLEEVAEEAGYSKGAVYSNFTGKEDLFAALLEQRCHDQLAEIQAALWAEPLTAARLRQIGDTLGARIQHDREWTLLFVEFWARAVRDPELGRRFAAIWQQARGGLAELIARHATDRGVDLPVAPQQLAAAAMALANGLALQLLADPERVSPQTLGNALGLLFAGLHAFGDERADGGPASRERPASDSSDKSISNEPGGGG